MNKLLNFSYDIENFPVPAPVIPDVILERPLSSTQLQVRGLLDSGADGSAINPELVLQLGLAKAGETAVYYTTDFGEEEEHIEPLYSVRVIVPNLYNQIEKVIASPRVERNQILIGRDILNEWFVELWGPSMNGVIRLSPPP